MHLLGDTAEDILEITQGKFNVDMSLFQFNKYFQDEFSKDIRYIDKLDILLFFKLNLTSWDYFINIKKKVDEVYRNYYPITLSMIEMSIIEKNRSTCKYPI